MTGRARTREQLNSRQIFSSNTRTRQGTLLNDDPASLPCTPLHPDTMSRRTLEIAAFCAALLLAALIFHAWLAAHDDQLRLSATLATQKQALDAADARERDRTATLKDALAQIDALKRAAQTQTPAQLARALQDALHLPQPITIVPTPNTPSSSADAASSSVGARHAVPEQANSTVTPLSNDVPARDVRTVGLRPAPLASSTMQQGSAKNSQQGTAQRARSLLDSLFHRASPRTPADAPSSAAAPTSGENASVTATPPTSLAAPQSSPSSLGGAGTPASEHALEVRSAGLRSAPLLSASTQQGTGAPLPNSNASNPPNPATQSSPSGFSSTGTSVHPEDRRACANPSPGASLECSSPTQSAAGSAAQIPAADLAPLYEYVQDCRACQLQLTAAKQNATDDAAKIRALTRERDAAVTAARGGSFWLRLKRNAHWLAIGAAIGVVTSTAALCNTGHCRK